MAGTLTVATRNKLLNSLGLKTIKLHSADPTDSGTTGAIPGAVADLTGKVNAAANGAIQTSGSVEIDITVSGSPVTVSHYSLWDNSSTPVIIATGALSSSQTYNTTGKYIVNTLTIDLNK